MTVALKGEQILNQVSGTTNMKQKEFLSEPACLICAISFLILVTLPAYPQQDSLNSLVKKFDNYWSQHLPEKVYVHASGNFLLTGETIWFNVFLVDGFLHKPNDLSKVVYLDYVW